MNDHPLLSLIVIIAPLSLLAVGGASSIYAPLQHQTVDVMRWVTGREFVDMFAIARVTPGPGSMITALLGWRVAGFLGAVVATLALYIPCSTLCFVVARLWRRYRGTPWHTAVESGLRPIGAGLMIAGGVAILRVEDSGLMAWGIALGATAFLLWRPKTHPILLLAIGAVVTVAIRASLGTL
jgi:chromate transporter